MKTKRRGVKINCVTFRVLPDPVVDLWRQGQIHDSSVKVWVCLQKISYEHKNKVGFNVLQQYAGVGRATLSRALRQLIDLGLIQRDNHVYTVVFDSGSTMEPTSSKMEPTSSKMEPTSSKMEPTSSKMEPHLSSNRGGELKRDIERIGDSRETPTPRSAASLERSSSSNGGGASADSHLHISPEDLALLAQRYGIRFARQPSPWAAVIIRDVLSGEGGEGHLAILRTLAARGNGEFAGAAATAPDETNTTTGGKA